jgi:hypothetical protein
MFDSLYFSFNQVADSPLEMKSTVDFCYEGTPTYDGNNSMNWLNFILIDSCGGFNVPERSCATAHSTLAQSCSVCLKNSSQAVCNQRGDFLSGSRFF